MAPDRFHQVQAEERRETGAETGLIERDGLAVDVGLITATLAFAIVALASMDLIVAVRASLAP